MASSTVTSSSTLPALSDALPNPSLVVTADGQIKLEAAPINEPGPDDVLLHVRATGICGSDIHFWRHGKIGDLCVEGDCILGHESAAVVLKTGSNVHHLKNGTLLPSSQSPLSLSLSWTHAG
jgi:L-iditol 2-dehydrogenase